MGNTFGKIFAVTTFGESHGLGIGAVVLASGILIRNKQSERSAGGFSFKDS